MSTIPFSQTQMIIQNNILQMHFDFQESYEEQIHLFQNHPYY